MTSRPLQMGKSRGGRFSLSTIVPSYTKTTVYLEYSLLYSEYSPLYRRIGITLLQLTVRAKLLYPYAYTTDHRTHASYNVVLRDLPRFHRRQLHHTSK